MLPHRLAGSLLIIGLDRRRDREVLVECRGLCPVQLESLRIPYANEALDSFREAYV